MGTRRRQRTPFGMSLLDLLCCAFGGTILLIVLNQQLSEAALLQAKSRLATALAGEARAVAEKHAAVDRAGRTRKLAGLVGGRSSSLTRLPFLPELSANRIVVVLDVSGSMRTYGETASPGVGASKWRQAETVITQLLMQQPALERFAVLALDDGRRTSTGARRLFPADAQWANGAGDSGLDEIISAASAIRATAAAGGADHTQALAFAIDEYVRKADTPADAIVLITDGLPNVRAGSLPATPVPVTPDQKRALAATTLRQVSASLERLPSDRRAALRLHVVCLEWPDDAELPSFGLALASLGNGYCVYLSPEENPGG